MPFARYRCRYETDNRNCRKKNAGCTYIHHEDPEWETAPSAPSHGRDTSRGGTHTAAAGGNAGNASTAEGWGSWGPETGWGTETAGGSTSTPSQVATPAQPNNPSTSERNQADTASGNTQSSEHGWGGSAEQATGSGRGSTGNDGWGSNWGNTDKAAESGCGGNQNDGCGASSSWNNKDADKNAGSALGNAQNDGWGSGWGNNKDTTNSGGAPDPMVVDNHAEKGTERNKGKGRAAPVPPPRIRIPDYENKKTKISGTNNEPLGPSKWGLGEPLSSNLVTSSTSEITSTPVATITPTDSTRVKRKRDAAPDDKLDVFKEYIKTWERGVRARFLLAEAEVQRDRWFRTQKSACYARIGEAGRKRLDGQRAECDQEVSVQNQKLTSAITLLVQFHDRISSNLDLGQRYNIGEEAEKFITDSKAFVDEVRALLVAHVLKDKNDVQSGGTQEHGASVASIDSLQSQVQDLEERFDQAQTELTLRHQRDIRSEVDELLAARIATLRAARQREVDRVASQPRPEIVIPPSALEDIERMAQKVKELDAKVPQTVEDIRVLLLRVDATTKRVSELEEELSTSKATYEKLQEMAAEKAKTERRMDDRLEKIQEQFEQLVASQGPAAQPTISPTIYDSREKLMEILRPAFEAVLNKFYEQEVRPTVESLQRVVLQASDRHQEEAIKVLWGKIQPAMNMVAGVSRWLDSQELGLTAPQGS
ncbi:hypothetical protein OG21DRAFT_464982 [Imleria badia]|nr:hypothetical protein OG21DRAFT_464982 [Imleria badia]